jgi:hypothetical protein
VHHPISSFGYDFHPHPKIQVDQSIPMSSKERPDMFGKMFGKAERSHIREIPQRSYMHLITDLHVDPDFACSNLRCVEERDKEHKIRKYRIFNVNTLPKGFVAADYVSFDTHPELVLFEGTETDDGKVNIVKKAG